GKPEHEKLKLRNEAETLLKEMEGQHHTFALFDILEANSVRLTRWFVALFRCRTEQVRLRVCSAFVHLM
ncbi:MAG: hypothetical protein II052_02025, partial [Prevotella sp.]|nr:hypothetical protein [Prevotella sp.]